MINARHQVRLFRALRTKMGVTYRCRQKQTLMALAGLSEHIKMKASMVLVTYSL
jgi:hypothetical protein